MNLFQINKKKYSIFILLSLCSALSNILLLYLITNSISLFFKKADEVDSFFVLSFLGCLIAFFVSRWVFSFFIIQFTQSNLKNLRLSIIDIILKSPYLQILNRKNSLYTAMTRDVGNIVQASVNLVDVVTSSIIILICFVYMAIISWELFVIVFGLLIFTVVIYIIAEKKGKSLFNKAMINEDQFIKYLNDILLGFKEITLNKGKGQEIKSLHVNRSLDNVIYFNKKASLIFLNNRIIGQVAFYLLIGTIIVLKGRLLDIEGATLVNFVFLTLYIFGPIETVAVLIPTFSQTRSSLERLTEIGKDLESIAEYKMQEGIKIVFENCLELRNIMYKYKDESGFSIGPINFKLVPSSIVFIYGQNGSGKSTLLNLITGLYNFDTGKIYINGEGELDSQTQAYRSLFAPVFSNFHLFDQLYGINFIDENKVGFYIRLFCLENKIQYEDKRFSSINLSTGQKKRLALICALLENRPIIVLDEFAADQDPFFRRKFYIEILPILKSEGFTIIAVTHDDSYYNCCDTLYKMENGNLKKMDLAN